MSPDPIGQPSPICILRSAINIRKHILLSLPATFFAGPLVPHPRPYRTRDRFLFQSDADFSSAAHGGILPPAPRPSPTFHPRPLRTRAALALFVLARPPLDIAAPLRPTNRRESPSITTFPDAPPVHLLLTRPHSASLRASLTWTEDALPAAASCRKALLTFLLPVEHVLARCDSIPHDTAPVHCTLE